LRAPRELDLATFGGKPTSAGQVVSMAPRKETAVQRSKRLAKESHHLSVKADTGLIMKCMQTFPDCVPNIKRTLLDLNYLLVDAEGEFSLSTAAAGSAGPGTADAGRVAKSPGNKTQSLDFSLPVPQTMQHADGEVLGLLLEACEPVSLSTFALKANLSKNQRKLPRNLYYELFEFVFDQDRDTQWSHAMTSGGLLAELKEANIRNGRRAEGLRMPVNWGANGLYTVDVVDGSLVLSNRFSGQSVQVQHSELSLPTPISPADFCIMNNYSSRCAALVRHGRMFNLPCCTMLPILPPLVRALPGPRSLPIEFGQPAVEDAPAEPPAQGPPPAAPSRSESARFETPPAKRMKLRGSPASAVSQGSGRTTATPPAPASKARCANSRGPAEVAAGVDDPEGDGGDSDSEHGEGETRIT